MENKEEKECRDFLDKFIRAVSELNNDFAKLSADSKKQVERKLVEFLEAQKKAAIIQFIRNGL